MSNKNTELILLRAVNVVCLAFGILSIVASMLASSKSLLLDGMYSLIQSVFILISGRVVTLLFTKDNDTYQFGYRAFEPFFIVIRSAVMLFMILGIGGAAVVSLCTGGNSIDVSIALRVSIISLVGCIAVWSILFFQAKRLQSPVLKTESRSWFVDSIISFAAVLSMVLIHLFNEAGYVKASDYVDPIMTILFTLGLSPLLLSTLVTSARELLGAAPPKSVQKKLEQIVKSYVKKENFLKSEVFANQQGRSLAVTIYIYLKEERKVSEIDAIRAEMLQKLRSYSSWCEADIIFTLDDRWVQLSLPLAVAQV